MRILYLALSKSISRSLLVALSLSLTACGGGGGGGSSDAAEILPQLTLSGTVSYTDFPLSSRGIDYNAPLNRPVRGVVVELRNTQDNVLASSVTDDAGSYRFNVDRDTDVRVLVRAELQAAGSVNTRVVDNTREKSLYAIFADTRIAGLSADLNLVAASGWGGSAYTADRAAAPFSILDTIYQGQELLRSVDPSVSFPLLTVNWSPDNLPNDGDLAAGEIGTSFYSGSELYILGSAGLDTDEYDDGVIGHEWGHYVEDTFSRSDSVGGPHGGGDLLHPSLAYSEGLATAFSSIVRNDPLYIDTFSIRQSRGSVTNVDADNNGDFSRSSLGSRPLLDGYYSENSVMELVFDLYDGATANPENGDEVALGFGPIYEAITGGVKNSSAFSSIFTLLHYLKEASPEDAAGIDELAAAENIFATRADEFHDPLDLQLPPMYTDLSVGVRAEVDARGQSLQTNTDYGPVDGADDGNKLLNHRFFKVEIEQGGCFSVVATPAGATPSADLAIYFINRLYVDRFVAGEESTRIRIDNGETLAFAVSAFTDAAFFSVLVDFTTDQC